jgi:uncharacterized zinc-type alcohol dehydrogenase-like protein
MSNPSFNVSLLVQKTLLLRFVIAGVCHSDIHTIRGDWGKIQYSQIVGHELGGEVVAVGSSAGKFNVGARVGTMVSSCRSCTEVSLFLSVFTTLQATPHDSGA